MKKPDAGKWKAVILTAMLLLLPAAQADAAGMPESGIQDYIQNPGQEADSFAGHTENNETEAGGHQAEYTDSQGIIYHLDGNACCVSGYTENLPDSATIPEQQVTENGIYSVKGIQQQAFTACSQLKKIEIPNSVTDIAKGVFSECRNLSSISVIPAEYRIQKNGKTAVADIRINSVLLGEAENVRLKIHKSLAAEAAAQKGTSQITISIRADGSGTQQASPEQAVFDADAAKVLSKSGKALKIKLISTSGDASYIMLDKNSLKQVRGSLKLKLQKQKAASASGVFRTDLQKALKKNGISEKNVLICQTALAGMKNTGTGLVLPVNKALRESSAVYVYRYSKNRRDFLTVLYHPASVSSQGNLRLSLNKGGIYILSAKPLRYLCRKLANTMVTESGSTYYIDKNGQAVCGWKKLGESYYYFDRETGKMASGRIIDGIRLEKNGQAEGSSANIQKIQTMIKARSIVLQVTDPQDSLEEKMKKCFLWVFQFPYRRYRRLNPIYRQAGWEVTFANDIFDRHQGCCVSEAAATAFLFHECGCKTVYVAADTSHAWTEYNGRVYDPLFAEARGFDRYYNRPYEGYGMYAVVKHKI